jgi:hypothetical protein
VASSTVTKYARSAAFIPKKDGPFSDHAAIEPISLDEAITIAPASYSIASRFGICDRSSSFSPPSRNQSGSTKSQSQIGDDWLGKGSRTSCISMRTPRVLTLQKFQPTLSSGIKRNRRLLPLIHQICHHCTSSFSATSKENW